MGKATTQQEVELDLTGNRERQESWVLQGNLADKFWGTFCPLLPGRRLGSGYPGLMDLMLNK